MTQRNGDADIQKQIDLVMSILDDLTKMYLKLEEDLWRSGLIQKKPSDDGALYDISNES